MNAERLLEQYEKIADAPDAIARLRRFILDLAVRGKLVQQAPKDEPASALLERIKEVKAELFRSGVSKADKPIKLSFKEVSSFPLPSLWQWTDLQSVCLSITDGDHLPPPKSEEGVPFLVIGDVRSKTINYSGNRYVGREYYDRLDAIRRPLKGDVLYTLVGSFGIPVPVEDGREFCVQRHIGILRPSHEISRRFLTYVLESSFIFEQADACATGIAQRTVPLAGLRAIVIPLPPLAEQHRIVAKVDELMMLCDQLEAVRTMREATRDRLAAASLARLNTPDPETFADDAHFALDALPTLTARPDQIKQLRQTILNLAVRGMLVPQDPKDEPAEEFDTALPNALVKPFSIPSSWKWSRLGYVGKLRGGGTPSKSNSEFWHGEIPWVSPKDMKVDYITDAQMAITQKAVQESSVNLIDRGSLLFVVRGMILAHSFPVAIAQEVVTVNQDMKALTPKRTEMAEYLLRALKGLKPQMLARVQRSSHGTCRLEGSDYADFLMPIPPLTEQHRIVAKVDELMALCDQLEARLATAGVTRGNLLDALFAEALTPANNDQRRDAAE